ncbi:MAG: type II toxin-antitoxin system VapB family antitoxin [Deltaproteobacteria bacterium]|jgi:metal-responsive CopG/Arc/MetJ family transcriptional regulator|nr:type II toxin-antitoxin system VapB family antitoxin [Deltaproteobacteria bacterium]
MRATLNIPDDLLSEVQKISGEKSKTKAITTAMEEFIKQKKIKELIALKGKVRIDYDWEKEEELEMKAQKKREKLLEK